MLNYARLKNNSESRNNWIIAEQSHTSLFLQYFVLKYFFITSNATSYLNIIWSQNQVSKSDHGIIIIIIIIKCISRAYPQITSGYSSQLKKT